MEVKEGYKKTEIGIIPEDWGLNQLNEVCKLITDGAHLSPPSDINGKPIATVENIIKGAINIESCRKISEKDFDYLIKNNCKPLSGDVLLTKDGTIGISITIDKEIEVVLLSSIAILRPKESLDGVFLNKVLSSHLFLSYLNKIKTGSALKRIVLKDINKIIIPFPPLSEQQAIAEVLTDTDNLIQALEKQIAKKKLIKQGVMQQLLTPKEGWEVKTLKEIANFRRGSFPQPYGLDKWYDDNNGFPFVQVFDVAHNMFLKAETKRRISELAKDMSVFAPKGTLILTIQGSIGRIAITQYDAYIDRTLLIFESFKYPFDLYFLMLAVHLLFEIEKQKAPGGIIKTITKEALSSFKIAYPDVTTQNQISKIIFDIDKEIQNLDIKLEKIKQLKQGLMQQLLTGKIRLLKS